LSSCTEPRAFRGKIEYDRDQATVNWSIEPAITIGLVGLAFTFIPWLSKGGTSKEMLRGPIRAGLDKFERKIADVQEKAKALEATPNDNEPRP
jgi:hypothetical protein